MATKSLSCPPIAADNKKRLTVDALDLDSLIEQVSGPDKGAVVTFSGNVRECENGKPIRGIFYEAYKAMAEIELARLIREAEHRWIVTIEVAHKTGFVAVGEASLLVACGGPHRRETFEACSFVVEAIKQHVPIWKVNYEWK